MNVLYHSFNFFCNTKLCQIHFLKNISSSQFKFRDPVPGTPGQVNKNLIQFGPGKINRNYYWSLLSEGRDDQYRCVSVLFLLAQPHCAGLILRA